MRAENHVKQGQTRRGAEAIYAITNSNAHRLSSRRFILCRNGAVWMNARTVAFPGVVLASDGLRAFYSHLSASSHSLEDTILMGIGIRSLSVRLQNARPSANFFPGNHRAVWSSASGHMCPAGEARAFAASTRPAGLRARSSKLVS